MTQRILVVDDSQIVCDCCAPAWSRPTTTYRSGSAMPQPPEVLWWLAGAGLWFANVYQVVAVAWLAGLLAITAKVGVPAEWGVGRRLGSVAGRTLAVPIVHHIRWSLRLPLRHRCRLISRLLRRATL
jgi:hypothetical protein